MALEQIDILFDGPPNHASGRFIEVEDAQGRSLRVGEWLKLEREGRTVWALRLKAEVPDAARANDLTPEELADLKEAEQEAAAEGDGDVGFGSREA